MFGKKITFILFAVVLIGASFFVVQKAHAITLVPPSLEYTLKPGETTDGFLKIINEETAARTLYVSSANFTAKDETGVPNFLFNEPSADLASWIQVNLESVDVEPQHTLQIPFRIAVPSTAEPGGYYAGIFFGTQPPTPEGGQVAVGAKIGTLIIVRVEGDILESATVKEFALDAAKSHTNRLPAVLDVRVENKGNVHVRPTGAVTIKNMFGRVVKEFTFNDAQGAVLPNSTRRFDVEWSKKATSTEESKQEKASGLLQELKAEWKNFALGKYTSTLAATYGQQKQSLAATATFTIIPWRVLTVGAIVLILIILLLIFGIKKYNAMIIRRAQQKMMGSGTTT